MSNAFSISGRIRRQRSVVFQAVVDPSVLSRYFTTGGAEGRLEAGTTVWWSFADFPGRFPVTVTTLVENERVEFRWGAGDTDPDGTSYETVVVITFGDTDDGAGTVVTIAESGWRDTEAGRRSSYGNCEGWTNMLCCLKAWVEHGIVLRDGFYA